MRIGISTASFFPKEKTEETFEIIQKLGIPVCEVFLCTFYEYRDEFIDELLDVKKATEIYSVHTLNQQFEPELFNPAERTRKDCERIYRQVGRDAGRLGAKCYTFHGPAKLKKLPYVHDYLKLGKRVEEIRGILKEAAGGKIELCYENVHWTYFNTPNFFNELKKHTDVYTCLDIKQAHLSGYGVFDYVDCMGDRLKNVHLCDFDDSGRLAIPGKGTYDFTGLFKKLGRTGYDGPLLIEVYAGDYDGYDDLARSYDYLNECLYKATNNGGF